MAIGEIDRVEEQGARSRATRTSPSLVTARYTFLVNPLDVWRVIARALERKPHWVMIAFPDSSGDPSGT